MKRKPKKPTVDAFIDDAKATRAERGRGGKPPAPVLASFLNPNLLVVA